MNVETFYRSAWIINQRESSIVYGVCKCTYRRVNVLRIGANSLLSIRKSMLMDLTVNFARYNYQMLVLYFYSTLWLVNTQAPWRYCQQQRRYRMNNVLRKLSWNSHRNIFSSSAISYYYVRTKLILLSWKYTIVYKLWCIFATYAIILTFLHLE